MKPLVVLGVLISCLQGVWGQGNRPPIVAEGVRSIDVREDAQLGQEVIRITAFDPDNDKVTFGLRGLELFTIDRDTGVITVTSRLDYERDRQVTITLSATDGQNPVTRDIIVNIIDVNDAIPEFVGESYSARIPENANPGTTVVSSISVRDPDTVNSELTVICLRRAEANERDPCDFFRTEAESVSTTSWRGHLILTRQLDFEDQRNFMVPLQASDGVNQRQTVADVTVTDVQDQPPVFVGSLTASILENSPIGTEVMVFSATDADNNNNANIIYELVSNPGSYFALDERTGRLTTIRDIDRETLSVGLITIQVAAKEQSGGDIPETVSRTLAHATITIGDVNDNGPRFETIDPAISDIKENAADGTSLRTVITVVDRDSGANSQFRLRLLNYNDTFEVFPSVGRGSLTVKVRVKDPSKLDYERGPKQYVLELEAMETQTRERRRSTALITVNVEDVNDNVPQFSRTSYTAEVSELATGGTVVTTITATDADSGIFGNRGIRYKLSGNGAERFKVNRVTGEITVKACATPGRGNCLDAERQDVYTLTFLARDNYAEGFVEQVPLTIRILDENDNSPVFSLGSYESFIREGEVRPQPPITVQATDADSDRNGNNRITYSIIGGNNNGLWQIGRTSGVVTATRPVGFSTTPGGSGVYTLTVQAADPRFRTTGTVRIRVQDNNDFSPVFVPSSYYEVYIPEDAPPGTSVITIQAFDDDSPNSPNGRITYRFAPGSSEKFTINPQTGLITVNTGAVFDFDSENRFNLRVIAEDGGSPRRGANGTVVVFIRDANNKKPYFEQSSLRVDLYENATVNTRVTQMTATDLDTNAVLVYSIIEPINAWNPRGRQVDIRDYNYRELFGIDPNSGTVRTRTRLDRDRAAVVSLTVHVRDTTGGPDQTATATLIVNILEINDRPPQFPPPWTPTNRRLNISVLEELAPSVSVTNIVATDPFDAVVDYRIIEDPGDYFIINRVTGVVTMKRPIDYETTQRTYFVVTAADDGRPPLTSTATVSVNVININDNNPGFTESDYNVDLPENSPPGTTVVVLRAEDLDLGDYGVIRYELNDPRFAVDPITGVVTVKQGADLDRETTDLITLNVVAYDSPNTPNVRKHTKVPIYITLTDSNDHPPTFRPRVYVTSISENALISSSVIQVTATDADVGDNAKLTYFFLNGDPRDLFYISPTTGLITTSRSLKGTAGQYNYTVAARDGGTPAQQGEALVIINIIAANNEAPTWIEPRFDNATIGVLENQYLGMIITQVVAEDDGEGEDGEITYGFYYNNQFVAETPFFRINPITGVITARYIFDREANDKYLVQLVARDGGNPPFETTRFVNIQVLDTDDHDPTFPRYQNCCVVPVTFNIEENQNRSLYVGEVKATDLDIGQNAETRYYIIGGNVGDAFYVNATTGIIYTNKSLDHEVRSRYTLAIRASNIRTKNRPNLIDPACKCKDPSVILVTVNVRNENDFAPTFSNSVFNACVSVDAQPGKSVTTMRAIDPDATVPNAILYNITSTRSRDPTEPFDDDESNDIFSIGLRNGSVHTRMLMTLYRDKHFILDILARDLGGRASSTKLRVFVTDPAQEVIVTVEQPPDIVQQGKLEEIVQYISRVTGGGIVCVNDVRYHVNTDGVVILEWTDILLHVVDGSKLIVWDLDRLIPLIWPSPLPDSMLPLVEDLDISAVGAANSFWSGFIIDPVLAAVILVLLLLFLLLLLLCCLYCCKKCCFKDKKSVVAASHLTGTMNPMWKERLYEDQELNMNLDTVDRAGFAMGEGGMARLALGDGVAGGAGGGGGVTQTTRTETHNEYSMNYERTTMQQMGTQGALQAGQTGDMRIEAPLEGSSGFHGHAEARNAALLLNGGTGSMLGGSLMADNATQVELMASRASLRDESAGESAIGARLHSYALGGTQEIHSNDFYSSGEAASRLREEEYISSWPRHTTMGSSGQMVHDSHHHVEDADYHHVVGGGGGGSTRGMDATDGLYQGEIILGSYHPPTFPNQQRQETRYHSQQHLYESNNYI